MQLDQWKTLDLHLAGGSPVKFCLSIYDGFADIKINTTVIERLARSSIYPKLIIFTFRANVDPILVI